MGRKIPTGEIPLAHPEISLSLLAASIAAIIAIISSLCAARLRRKASTPPSASPRKPNRKSEIVVPPPPSTTATTTIPMMARSLLPIVTTIDKEDKTEDKTEKQQQHPQVIEPLKLPPIRHLRGSSSQIYMSKSTSKPRLVACRSMLVSRSTAVARYQSRREEQQGQKNGKLKTEDSVWMKTIILGEKCRVPDEEDDAILYDDKGNRISTYHPKTPRSLPVSRTNSFIDPEALPS
ncbi:hypothetical protein L1049_018442 [Liquidambar formosana]|uniref:Uncharacterized protein n=1 Tax=Liquidambar formosana TaxID=63359 RepID=A0AAP0RAM5_LIQFO